MSPFAEYLAALRKRLAQGDATEQTHRGALEHLLEAIGKGITATNEPKRIACGAPDFNITRHKVPLGHVETKDIGISLDEMERGKGANGEQFKRYRDALPNWILTDYLEFRWFVAGEKRLVVRLADFDDGGRLRALPEADQQLAVLLDSFFTVPALTVGTAKELAQRLAGMTRNVRDLIIATFAHGSAQEKDWLQNWLTSFREVLIPELDEAQFADMFGQTLAYGLFAARIHTPTGEAFSREMAAFGLPKTNPFLRKLFAEFAGVDMPETFGWAVDDIVELLKDAAMEEILKDFGEGKGKQDPVVHFYETFLAAYDPKMRELRGVYYTPEPVVSYIVRSIDYLLKTRFDRPKGLADETTLILDPAAGTATFLYFVVRQIYQRFASQKGAWDSYVSEHLLKRLFGFELLMAPYAIAHLKLGLELQETGYSFGSGQRLGIYLTNTLEEAAKRSEKVIAKWISDEADEASEIKRERPILVVLGNPPYSGHSANRSEVVRHLRPGDSYKVVLGGPLRVNKVTKVLTAKTAKTVREKTFIGDLIDDYKVVDGVALEEKNPKWLQNDYVKFIRWGQWRISRTGGGVLAFITDHSYLDSPTFRGMRRHLMRAFSEIYILDLHGNSKKEERCPDGSEDRNVFDIQEGVAIGVFVMSDKKTGYGKVWHADLWGVRETRDKRGGKYPWLFEHDLAHTRWKGISPQPPLYLFKPQKGGLAAEYATAWSIRKVTLFGNMGITTGVNSFAIAFTPSELKERVAELGGREDDVRLRHRYNLRDTSSFSLSEARKWAKSSKARSSIIPIAYRCFDSRFVIYSSSVLARSREDICRHLLAGSNYALVTFRAIRKAPWAHVFVSEQIATKEYLSSLDNCYLFPLYLYDEDVEKLRQSTFGIEISPWSRGKDGRWPNLSPEFVGELENRLGLSFVPDGKADLKTAFGPEDVFNYAYGIFYSPTYRKRYAELLKSDFPRLPLTSNLSLFADLTEKGFELVSLHLMKSPKLDELITTFPEKGSNGVDRVTYVDASERVCINGVQYFQGVPREVWEFRVGGYQILQNWLKERKGRELTWDDIQHYQKIVVAVRDTIRLMAEIDAVIDWQGGWPLR
jgi:predicted helicase